MSEIEDTVFWTLVLLGIGLIGALIADRWSR